jgi:hypothetical protein
MNSENISATQSKPKAIVAGIIDTRTGAISDTITNPSGKTRLYLKVRDELNAVHGKDAFMVFEFNSTLGANFDYIQRHMKSKELSVLGEIRLLKARYKVQETELQLESVKKELALMEETVSDCLSICGESAAAKREIIEDAFSDKLRELELSVESMIGLLFRQKENVKKLEIELKKD